MRIEFEHPFGKTAIDDSRSYDLSISINKRKSVSCYFLDPPIFRYFESPEFSGNLDGGGSVNCERIGFYAHASGTHTECALHVLKAEFDMRHIQIPPLIRCKLISITPEHIGDDHVITLNNISTLTNKEQMEAIIFRTLPNGLDKLNRDYSGSNPAYFDPAVLLHLRALGFDHLLCDLPSIDRESDEGKLSAHKNWFSENGIPDKRKTITELIYVEDHIPDGNYVVNMQFPAIETDAVPSRVFLYPCL